MGKDWMVASGLSFARAAGRLEQVDWKGTIAGGDPQIAWLGHACFMLRWQGQSIVIDPVFREWVGVSPRLLPLPPVEKIGKVDAVLVSHGHMDHLDSYSIRRTGTKRIVIPGKAAGLLGSDLRARSQRVELGDTLEMGDLRLWVVPAVHGGWRYPWQRGYFACGFALSDGERCVYIAGDTAFGPHFREIGSRWSIDTALLPIGAYSPQWFLQKRHLNPEEACMAAKDLGAKEVIPFHFGTYRLSLESLVEPLTRFAVAAKELGIEWRVPLGLG